MAQAKHKFDFGPNVFGKNFRIECYTLVLALAKYAIKSRPLVTCP